MRKLQFPTITIFGSKVPEVISYAIRSRDDGRQEIQVTFVGRVSIDKDGNLEMTHTEGASHDHGERSQ